jgi:hypothetical protein
VGNGVGCGAARVVGLDDGKVPLCQFVGVPRGHADGNGGPRRVVDFGDEALVASADAISDGGVMIEVEPAAEIAHDLGGAVPGECVDILGVKLQVRVRVASAGEKWLGDDFAADDTGKRGRSWSASDMRVGRWLVTDACGLRCELPEEQLHIGRLDTGRCPETDFGESEVVDELLVHDVG